VGRVFESPRGHHFWWISILARRNAALDPALIEVRLVCGLVPNEAAQIRRAHCHLGLGKLSWRTGKRDEAGEHLTTATVMYREMDMRIWLEKAKADAEELA
jgi:hypothetical protein